MIEMALVAMLVASITVRTAAKGITDVAYAVRGKPSPRYDEARKRLRKPSGAASRYWSRVWEDAWTDALKKHDARRARREGGPSPSSSRPRGAGTVFAAGLFQDWWRAVRRSWDAALVRVDEKRRAKATRPRPGTTVVPGEVVPDSPVPSPSSTVPSPSPSSAVLVEDEPTVPSPVPEGPAEPVTTTTMRGTTTMSSTPSEVTGLYPAIDFCDITAAAAQSAVSAIEQTQAAIVAGDGAPPAELATAMEHFNAAAAAMTAAGNELRADSAVTEVYDARPSAPDKAFATGGR